MFRYGNVRITKNCINNFDFLLPFLKRYVDDIIPSGPYNEISGVLEVANDFHPKFQFTLEKEYDNSISFLDKLFNRDENNYIKSNWYHKPTFSERCINSHCQYSLS